MNSLILNALRNANSLAPCPLYVEAIAEAEKPIPMILYCPRCHKQHIDKPEHWDGKVEEHRSHLCVPTDGGCGYIWRPADVATCGVEAIQTKGKNDSPPMPSVGYTGEGHSHECRRCRTPYTPIGGESEDCPRCGYDGKGVANG